MKATSGKSEIINLKSEMLETPAVLTVSELTGMVRSLLEIEIGDVWVEGEVSNFRRQSSGHLYFTLKDEHSQLACVMFRGATTAGGSLLADGNRVQLHGAVTVHDEVTGKSTAVARESSEARGVVENVERRCRGAQRSCCSASCSERSVTPEK